MLISVNPFRRIDALLTDECLHSYRGRYQHEQPPHVYALAEAAYRGVKSENINQCVIISYVHSPILPSRCQGAGRGNANYVDLIAAQSSGVNLELARLKRPSW